MRELINCDYCGFEHVPSKTMDEDSNIIGLFCDSAKLMIRVDTTKWNGEDITADLEKFLDVSVNKRSLKKMDNETIIKLSKKMAYLFLQTSFNGSRRINYAFTEYHARDIIYKFRETELREYGG